MASWWQSLLRRFSGQAGREFHLAAFGKHPGWDDHIDDIGLETPQLVQAKQRLYVQGIGGNTDSGAWEKLPPPERLDGFAHAFLWRMGSSTLAGRIWASRDGKGRGKYPMIVAAEGVNVSPAWMAGEAMEQLEQIEWQCAAASSADQVRQALDASRRALRERCQHAAPQADEDPSCALVELADHAELGPERRGLYAVMYQVDNELAEYARPERGDGGTDHAHRRAAHLRVPAVRSPAGESLWLWLRFMMSQLDARAPVLALRPIDQPWVDLIVGEPQAGELFCLLARPQVIPLTTQIPYTLDPAFLQRAESRLAAARPT